MKFAPHILIGAGLLAMGSAASAQPPGPPPAGAERPAPTRAALQARLEAQFDKMDTNRDGILTPEERKAAIAARHTQMREGAFARLDTNRDGAISREEFAAARAPADRAERMKRIERKKAGGEQVASREGNAHGALRRGMMARHHPGVDSDKPITRTAFLDAGLTRFDRVDTNRDGVLSAAEREAARKTMRPAKPSPPPPGQ